MKNQFEKIILASLLILMINHTIASDSYCGKPKDTNYEVSMRYVNYDELKSDDLSPPPPREGFNLNEKDSEDRALKYQDGNTDIIITINKTSTGNDWYSGLEIEKVEILDDTGLYTAHFLVQDLIKKANKDTREINTEDHDQQIKKIKKQLHKLKELVNEVATLGKSRIDAEDIEDSIGDEMGEGDGVLDVLDENPINVDELSTHWATLMNNVSLAKDIRIQAYKKMERIITIDEDSKIDDTDDDEDSRYYWDTVGVPSAWRKISHENLIPITLTKAQEDASIPGQTKAQSISEHYGDILKKAYGTTTYYASQYTKGHPLDVLLVPSHCTTVNSRTMGQPRSWWGRGKHFFRGGKKTKKSTTGSGGVQ